MLLILTMAGQDFRTRGYVVPKYLLPWGDTTVLGCMLTTLLHDGAFSDVLLVANKRDYSFSPHIRRTMESHGISPTNLFLIDDTTGQAQTAVVASERAEQMGIGLEQPVAFHNIDTILTGRDFARVADRLQVAEGYIDLFVANNPNYSYVLLEQGRIVEIAEKVLISQFATSGFYGFRSIEIFLEHARSLKPEERYISTVYRRMIARGATVLSDEPSDEHKTIVLGTPDDYQAASVMIDDLYPR